MFSAKQKQLIETTTKPTSVVSNPFIAKSLKKSAKTNAYGNGASKFTTSGNDFVDDFANMSNYKAPRAYDEIHKTMNILWSINKYMAICMIFYSRMITRVTQLFDGSKTSESMRGQGLKHEGIFRMMWVAINAPETFWKNIGLFISVGSWKDVIVMLSYDLQYNGWKGRVLDWDKFGKLILAGLENPNTSELIKKYLPQIKSNSQCKTLEAQADNIIAKWICSLLFGGKSDDYSKYKQYRLLKSKGTAHQWQQLISQGKHNLIDFNIVHGRALSKMVSGKYLANQGLTDKYAKWIASKPVAKFTGYPYELFVPLGVSRMTSKHLQKHVIDTINKQFLGVIETAKNGMTDSNNNKFISVLDSSQSMWALVPGTKVSAYSVAKVMTLYTSYLLEGVFANTYLEFSDTTIMKEWKGDNPVDKLCNDTSSIVAGTNFQSVGDHFNKILKSGVRESDFPNGIICWSDGNFNNTTSNKTNFKALLANLRNGGFSKEFVNNFKVVLWDIPNNHYGKQTTKFEDFADAANLFHISGLDPAALAFLTGTKSLTSIPKNSKELMETALKQEIMQYIEI
jgi:dimeric dUTPase (all-alpha-NTP-PPase superfamily)